MKAISDTANALQDQKGAKVTFGKFVRVVATNGRLPVRAELHINQLPNIILNLPTVLILVVLHCRLGFE